VARSDEDEAEEECRSPAQTAPRQQKPYQRHPSCSIPPASLVHFISMRDRDTVTPKQSPPTPRRISCADIEANRGWIHRSGHWCSICAMPEQPGSHETDRLSEIFLLGFVLTDRACASPLGFYYCLHV
jgi:hypothetical protein